MSEGAKDDPDDEDSDEEILEEYVYFTLTLWHASSRCFAHAKTKLGLRSLPCHRCMKKVKEMITCTEVPEPLAGRALDMPGRVKELGIKP